MLVFVAIFAASLLSGSSPALKVFVGIMMLWEIWGVYYFLKLLLGKEIIEVRADSLKIDKRIVWFSRSQEYPSELIRELQVLPNSYSQEYRTWPRVEIWWDKGGGTISFKAGSQDVQFGSWLDESEAQEIVAVIQKAFQKYNKKKISA